MKKFLILLTTLPMMAHTVQAQTLQDLRWKNRVIVLFTPKPDHPLFQEQCQQFESLNEALEDRKIKLVLVTSNGDDHRAEGFVAAQTAVTYYQYFGVRKHQFSMLLIGLDGGVKFRAIDEITSPQTIFDLIDTMPMRRQELRERGKD